MWDLIVSVPDHCLSFYFLHVLVRCGFLMFTSSFPFDTVDGIFNLIASVPDHFPCTSTLLGYSPYSAILTSSSIV